MKKLNELKQLRAAKNIEMKNLIKTDGEEKSVSPEDFAKFETLEGEIDDLDEQIRKLEKVQAANERIAKEEAKKIPKPAQGGGEEREVKKILKKYSIARAVRSLLPGQKLEGVEREMHEEAKREFAQTGRQVEGIGVPGIITDLTGRGLTVGANSGADGGYTVADDLGGMIPVLAPKAKILDLGVTVMPNMQGNFSLPRQTGLVDAAWEGEIDQNAESNAQFDIVKFSPKRLGAKSTYSKQLLLQSSIGVDALVKSNLESAIARALDREVFNGAGANGPKGIAAIATEFAMGDPDGGAITRDKLIDMIAQIKVDNADIGDMAFVMTNLVNAQAQKTKLDSGSGRFLLENAADALLGYKQVVSNLMPDNLTKGGSNGILHALFFGVFSEYILPNWGGLDLVVDPYTLADTSQVRIIANTWWDGNAKHDKAFVAAKDILV